MLFRAEAIDSPLPQETESAGSAAVAAVSRGNDRPRLRHRDLAASTYRVRANSAGEETVPVEPGRWPKSVELQEIVLSAALIKECEPGRSVRKSRPPRGRDDVSVKR